MSLNIPEETKVLLEQLKTRLVHLLDDNLIGIYLHGSIAMDCFNPASSDIDLLIVTKEGLPISKRREVIDLFIEFTPKAPPKGFEVSVLTQAQLNENLYPMPFELHFSNEWIELLRDKNADLSTVGKTDADLAAHITIIKSRGIVLYGRPIEEVFPEVPKSNYLDSISGDVRDSIADMTSDPVYGILNLCRVWAYMQDGLITSKREGGEWALGHADGNKANLIQQALESYTKNIKPQWSPKEIVDFGQYMKKILFES